MAFVVEASLVNAYRIQLTRLEHGPFAPNNRTPFKSLLQNQASGVASVAGTLYLDDGRIKAALNGLVPVGHRILALDVAELVHVGPHTGGEAPPESALVSINSQTLSRSAATSGGSRVTYRINASGVVEQRPGLGAYATLETWLLSGAASDYKARAIVNSGSVSGSPTNTWISCADSPAWYAQDSDAEFGGVTAEITVQLTNNDGLSILDAAAVSFESDYDTT